LQGDFALLAVHALVFKLSRGRIPLGELVFAHKALKMHSPFSRPGIAPGPPIPTYTPAYAADPPEGLSGSPAPGSATEPGSAADRGKRLVLLVEDLADTRDAFARILANDGFRVEVAGDGQECLDQTFALLPDLILLDIRLPVMSGWEVIDILKNNGRTRHIPIVGLTAFDDEGLWIQFLKVKCHSFLIKPCQPDVLIKEVRRVLRIL